MKFYLAIPEIKRRNYLVQRPKVSVCIVTYNQEDFIEEAVMSALTQDYDNIEVIVSDDASKDSTPEILKKLELLYYPRLKINLIKHNTGLVGNCNEVMSLCAGEYICLTGGDDVYLPGKIRKQIEFMQLYPEYLLTYHQVEVFESKTNKHISYFGERIIEGSAADLIENGAEFLPLGAMFSNTHNLPKFREAVPIASDWLFYIDYLISNTGKFTFMPGVYARYRKHTSNMTNTSSNKDNWLASKIMEDEYPEFKESIDRFRSRLAIKEFRSGAVSLSVIIFQFLKSPRSFTWAFVWLVENWLKRKNFRTLFKSDD